MFRFHGGGLMQSPLLLAAPLLLWLGWAVSASADCFHFTPFGQPQLLLNVLVQLAGPGGAT